MAHSTQDHWHQRDSGGFSSWLIWRWSVDLATSESEHRECVAVLMMAALEGNVDGAVRTRRTSNKRATANNGS